MKYCCLKKVPASCNANEAMAELKIWQLRQTTCCNTEINKTHSGSRAGWDVRGIESEYSPPGPNVEPLTVSLQQHGAVVDCRGLETPAALETWGRSRRREKDLLLMKVTFGNLAVSATPIQQNSSKWSWKKFTADILTTHMPFCGWVGDMISRIIGISMEEILEMTHLKSVGVKTMTTI